jgi:hypothetical protein
MNTKQALKNYLAAGLLLASVVLTGCSAQGDGSSQSSGNGSGITDTSNCAVPLGSSLCVLSGTDDPDSGLVNALLAKDGPLGPIAGAIDTSELTTALTNLLQNDGTLTSIVTGLLMKGQLTDALKYLLQGSDGSGSSGLAAILSGVLLPNDEGQGLVALFGADGIQGLVMALLVDGTSSDCQAPLGTLCLIAGSNSNQVGLVDLLLTSSGLLGSLSPTLTTGVTDDVVTILGNMLASNGSLSDLLNGLVKNGQLADALKVLLIGDSSKGVQSGLVQALSNLLGGLGSTVTDLINYLTSIFTGG